MSCLPSSRSSAAWTHVLAGLILLCSVAAFGQFSTSTSTSAVSFGSVRVGSTSSVPIPVANTSKSSLTISQVSVSGSQFSFTGPSLPVTLAPQQTANVYITFSPQAAGAASGSATIVESNFVSKWQKPHTSSVTVSLSGTGVSGGYLTPSPASLNFGSIAVGSSQTQSVTVTNTGGSSVGITQAAVSGTGFTMSGFSPQILAVGQSLTVSIGFSASATGTANGALSFSSTATNSSLSVALSGTGVSSGYLTPSPASLNFGSIAVGTKQTQSVTVTNTGGSSVGLTQAAVSGTGFTMGGFSAQTLAAGQSLTLSVGFTANSTGTATGALSLSSTASNSSLSVALSGTGVSSGYLTPSSASLNFGSISVGSSQTQSVTITNTGGSSVGVTQAAVSGPGFTVSGFSPQTLAAGQSLTLGVGFTANSAGAASGALSISSNATDSSLSVALSGSGTSAVGQLGASPVSVSFGTVTVGSSSNQSGLLPATGASVTVSSASSNNSQFTIGGLTLPVTIASGQSVPFTITFSPLVSGTVSGNLSFGSNASVSTISQTVSGSGQAVQHNVALSWSPSTSTVTGYNVYRGTTSGGPYTRINSALDAVTTYSDGTVQSGQTYYYVTTAVASNGMESTYSNETAAQVP